MSSTTQNSMLVALLDEYKRAVIDLKIVLEMLSQEEYELIRDPDTADPDCRSIHTICRHILDSGYVYANYLFGAVGGDWLDYKQAAKNPQQAISEVDKMITYTEKVLSSLWTHPVTEIESWTFDTRWSVTYNTEQLLEHAIVHILRHRRQIENFPQE